MRVVRQLLELLTPRAKRRLLILLVLISGTALLEAAGIASILPFIALVINPGTIHSNAWLAEAYHRFGFQSDKTFLTFIGTVVLVLLVLTNTAKMLSTWLTLRYQNRRAYELGRRMLVDYMVRPYAFFLGRNTSDLGLSVLWESSGLTERVLRPLIDFFAGGVTCLAITTVLLVLQPLTALIILTVIGGSYGVAYLLVRRKIDSIGLQQEESSTERVRSAAESMSGIKDLKVLGREATFLDRFAFHSERSSRNNAIAGTIAQLPRYILEVMSFGGLLLAVLYFIHQGNEAATVLPILALYAFAGYRLLPTVQTLFNALVIVKYNVPVLEKVHAELMSGHPSPDQAERELRNGLTVKPAAFSKALELRDITFQYEGAAEPSLRGLNLTVVPGSSVALVGSTGCGKTTTVDLILGLLLPGKGKLILDGVEITQENRQAWQRAIGYVPQSIFISDDTIARNIAFGIPEEQIDMEAVRKAAVIANLADFIDSELPNGYHTNIGERGARLSGGQRQRIGIARAMYRDPAILIMDEATSALDGITEEGVMRAVHNLSKKKTIILIAHRLSTVRECDVIYLLDRGAVVASGTYDDLIRESGWFRDAARGAE